MTFPEGARSSVHHRQYCQRRLTNPFIPESRGRRGQQATHIEGVADDWAALAARMDADLVGRPQSQAGLAA